MPALSAFNSAAIKCLNAGRPGVGKTGALISIVLDDPEARLFVCNFDRANIGTLAGVARVDPRTNTPRDPALVARLLNEQIFYHNFQDSIVPVNGIPMVVGIPSAFTSLGQKLMDWGPPLASGGVNNLTGKDWLTLDSVSAMGDAAMRISQARSSRLNRRPQLEDWGEAINQLSAFFEMFNDPDIRFNVMAITHIRFIGDMDGPTDDKGKPKEMDAYPNALGQKLPQELGRYFNNIIETRVVGDGPGARRLIYTQNPGGLVLRSSAPGAVKPFYDIHDGMAQWVRDIRSVPIPLPAPTPAPTPVPALAPAAASTPPAQPATPAATPAAN